MKEKIEDLYIEAVYNIISPNVFAQRVMNLFVVQEKKLLNVSDLLTSLGDVENEYVLEFHKSDDKWWITHKGVGSGEPLEQWLTNRSI